MEVNTAQDLLTRRLGDIHSSTCFLARHIPSMVSATESIALRKLLNLYLDVVRDNADRTEAAFQGVTTSPIDHDPTTVPAMIDDLFDLIEEIREPALVDVAILFSSNEIGTFEAQRFWLASDYAEIIGKTEAIEALREGSRSLSQICDQLRDMMQQHSGDQLPH